MGEEQAPALRLQRKLYPTIKGKSGLKVKWARAPVFTLRWPEGKAGLNGKWKYP